MKTLSTWAVAVLAVTVMAGCATGGAGGNEKANIQKTLDAWKQGVEAKNVDQIVACYADDFKHPEYGDKAGFKSFINDMVGQGAFDGAKVNTEKTVVTIDPADKSTATAGPVDLTASFGGAGLTFTLKKAGDKWSFTNMTVEQY